MKLSYILFLCLFSPALYADGLDEVKIFKNGKLIEKTTSFLDQSISVEIGDTLVFEVWTDWGGTMAGELEIFTFSDSSTKRIKREQPQRYEAVFTFVVTQDILYNTYEFTYHYKDSPREMEDKNTPWKFAILSLE